jgi:hypothetical protein
MELSKLKVEIYDLLALIIPGLLVICELAVTLRGWTIASAQLPKMNGAGLTVLLLFSFALGTILQELTDSMIKAWKGERFFKTSRDKLWRSPTGEHVRAKVITEAGFQLENVDAAFDYCLTKVKGSFSKRDLFLATSDLSRSLIVACCFALLPVTRVALTFSIPALWRMAILVGCSGVLFVAGRLCWARMIRFRELSEIPVFHAFLAIAPEKKTASPDKH